MIKQALDWVTTWKSGTNAYGLDLIAYEGGQPLISLAND